MKAKVTIALVAVCLGGPLVLAPAAAVAGGKKGVVLVINSSSNTVTVINMQKREVIADVRVGNNPTKLAVDSKGRFAYVINQGSDDLSIIDLRKLTVLDVPLGFKPLDIAATPKGQILIILHTDPENASGGDAFKGDYSLYDVKKGELVSNFLNGTSATGSPEACALTADPGGDLVWITACAADQVVVIDLKKAMNGDSGKEVKAVIDTETNPVFVGIASK